MAFSCVSVLLWWAVLTGADPLALGVLVGASPATVSASLGVAPTDEAFVMEGLPTLRAYALPDGTALDVTYCDERAVAFDARAGQPLADASALAAWGGVAVAGLVVREQGAGHIEWARTADETDGPGVLRLLAVRSEAGWDRLVVEATGAC